MSGWTAAQIPDQAGRVAVVTGANSGLGLVTATELARHGARVILAVRNTAAGRDVAHRMPGDVEVRELDLAALASVRQFAVALVADHPSIDLLINNAGVVLLGPRHITPDGFELQFGTNFLGHFALTGLLLPAVAAGRAPRVVSLSSITHRTAHLDFDDLMSERGYRASPAYGRSKLANTVFGLELDRRLRAAGSPVASVLAPPRPHAHQPDPAGLGAPRPPGPGHRHRRAARHPVRRAGRAAAAAGRDRSGRAGRAVLRAGRTVRDPGAGGRGAPEP